MGEKSYINKHQRDKDYNSYKKRKITAMLILIFLTIALSIIAINSGSAKIGLVDILLSLVKAGDPSNIAIVWNMRLPRIIGALIAGAGLSVAGCVMQNNLKNPMASPSTLGISNAAVFGANIAIIGLGAGNINSSATDAVLISNPYSVTIIAFITSILAMMVILTLSKLRSFSSESIILAGVALGSLFSAGTILIQYFADDVEVAAAVFWSFGDLGRIMWKEVYIMGAVVLLSIIYFVYKRWDYNAIETGREIAKSLGVDVDRTIFTGMILSSIITAVTVSFLGIIGFIGLISPHIVRRTIDGDHRYLIPMSAIMGGFILLLADTVARTIISPVILPVGAITSFLGAPLFLYLLLKRRQSS
jgi:iron complex transport system permease protein